MRTARPAGFLACLSILALAAAPASAEGIFGGRRKAEPAPVAAAPPPPPAAPPVGVLPGPVLQAAGAYRAYMRRAATVGVSHAGGELENSLELAETSEPLGLSRGTVAYAAVVALQEPAFVDGVRSYAGDPGQRRLIAERIAADPAYAAQMPGAAAAAAQIGQALAVEGREVAAAGARVKQSAYDMQRQSWSKADIPNRPGRLALAKTLAAKPMAATPDEMAELSAAAAPGRARLIEASTPASSSGAYTSTVVRGLAIAALAALGESGDGNDAVVQTLLNDPAGSFCHNMAKLNLYQCLAVAKPYYEDAFCLGQHILIDTGQCVVKGSGLAPAAPATVTAEAAPAPTPVAPSKARSPRRSR